jgi:hypothetical protein
MMAHMMAHIVMLTAIWTLSRWLFNNGTMTWARHGGTGAYFFNMTKSDRS